MYLLQQRELISISTTLISYVRDLISKLRYLAVVCCPTNDSATHRATSPDRGNELVLSTAHEFLYKRQRINVQIVLKSKSALQSYRGGVILTVSTQC